MSISLKFFFETATFTSVYIFTIWKKLEESEKSVFQVYLLSFFLTEMGKNQLIDWSNVLFILLLLFS